MKENSDIAELADVFPIKRELVLKEYDSLFTVYGRQTNIVFSFRTWTITLLTGYLGFLLVTNLVLPSYAFYLIPGFILFIFFILETAERSVMIYLIEDLRSLEKIFMNKNPKTLVSLIEEYEFRDLRDRKIKPIVRIKNFLKAIITPQVLSWYPIIAALTVILVELIENLKLVV